MSWIIRAANQNRWAPQATLRSGRMMYGQGDPGLFGAIGKVLGGVAKVGLGAVGGFLRGGPLGAVGGGLAATGLLGAPARQGAFAAAPIPAMPFALPGGMPVLLGPGVPNGGRGAMVPAGPGACPAGYKMVRGFGAGGGMFEKCVKRRRMNPLNPQAASRAMRRLVSAKKAVKFLARFTIRDANPKTARRRPCNCPKTKK